MQTSFSSRASEQYDDVRGSYFYVMFKANRVENSESDLTKSSGVGTRTINKQKHLTVPQCEAKVS